MVQRPFHALLQYDIVDLVLSYCVAPTAPYIYESGPSISCSLIPGSESARLAIAVLICKAWLEPALRHLYLTIHVATEGRNGVRQPASLFRRIGHRVRTLAVLLDTAVSLGLGRTKARNPDLHFRHFTGLTTLVLAHSPTFQLHGVPPTLLSCPSLPNLAGLFIFNANWLTVLDLLKACPNLRQFRFNAWHNLELAHEPCEADVRTNERLEVLVMHSKFHECPIMGEALHSLFAATHLVTLNIKGPFATENQRLITRAIQASPRSLRAISLQDLLLVKRKEDDITSRFFLPALLSCTSLRFLRLGDYPFIG
jgi:hypothetical protein